MISRKTAGVVSGVAVTAMMVVAWSEFNHGKPLGDIHLITAAPVTVGSTIVPSGAGYYHNAIIDADYRAPPATTPLPNDGLIQPSTGVTLFSAALGSTAMSTTSTV
jgi:hypothetical protein